MENLAGLSVVSLREMYRKRAVRPVEVVTAYLERIERINPTIKAFLHVFAKDALSQARALEKEDPEGRPLYGIPVAVKDNICTRGLPTTCASKILEHYRPPYDATVVDRLHDAGAVIMGKTNMDEFAMGSSTENSAFEITKNPWNEDYAPGGSSGGSAAAVAGGIAPAALGSDTGGSIRQPASFCGVVGLKPTYGRVSRYGLVAYGSSLDQIGPIARTVEDCALMLNVIAGHDLADSTSVNETKAPLIDYLEKLDESVGELKIAVVPAFNAGANEQVLKSISEAIEVYKTLRAEVIEVEMPHLDYAIAAYYVIATAEASSNLARYDGVHYGHRTENPADYIEVYSKSREEGFGKEVKRRIMLGTYALSSGYYDAYYLKALKVRNLIRGDFAKVFENCDCIMMPVSPTTAFKMGEKIDDPLQMYLSDIYTIAANLAGIPSISIPCGFDEQGLPIGLQIICPTFGEDKLLRIARMFERETDWYAKRPAIKEVIW